MTLTVGLVGWIAGSYLAPGSGRQADNVCAAFPASCLAFFNSPRSFEAVEACVRYRSEALLI